MAFDMKIFEDLLGDDMSDEYRSLLGNIGNPQAAPTSNASAFGFDESRPHGVASIGDLMNQRNAAHEKAQANGMLKQAQASQAYSQQEQARLAREAQLQSAANQFQHQGNQQAAANHAQMGMNQYYSALQQEKLRQQRAASGTPMTAAQKNGLMGLIMNPTGFAVSTALGGLTGGNRKKASAQPSAAQKQALMQQMLQGRLGKK